MPTVIVCDAVHINEYVGMKTATACHAAGGIITLDQLMTMTISHDITVIPVDQGSASESDLSGFMVGAGDLRLIEILKLDDVAAVVRDAIARGAIGFDVVKPLRLCRI